MATVRYFWPGFIHKGITFMYLQYSHPLVYHLLSNAWKASHTISASIFVDVPYWRPISTRKCISCVVPGPSHGLFHYDEEIVITWTHIGWVQMDVPESSISSGARGPWQQQRCDSLHCHEEWWGFVLQVLYAFPENIMHYDIVPLQFWSGTLL